MLFVVHVQELPKAQLAVVLVLKRLRRRVNGLKSHPTDWEKPRIEHATPGLQDIGLSPTPRRLLLTLFFSDVKKSCDFSMGSNHLIFRHWFKHFYLYTLYTEQHIKTYNNIQYTNGIQKKVFRLIRICIPFKTSILLILSRFKEKTISIHVPMLILVLDCTMRVWKLFN